jgi:hypothetical protein
VWTHLVGLLHWVERYDRGWGKMANHVYKTVELTGSSTVGVEDAIRNAIARASQTVRNMRWFEVTDTRGQLEGNQIAHWQVTLKVGFTLDA